MVLHNMVSQYDAWLHNIITINKVEFSCECAVIVIEYMCVISRIIHIHIIYIFFIIAVCNNWKRKKKKKKGG